MGHGRQLIIDPYQRVIRNELGNGRKFLKLPCLITTKFNDWECWELQDGHDQAIGIMFPAGRPDDMKQVAQRLKPLSVICRQPDLLF